MALRLIKQIVVQLVLCGTALAYPTYQLSDVYPDLEGNTYVVFSISESPSESHSPHFPVVVRYLRRTGERDFSFGEGGILSLQNWLEWPQASIADMKFRKDGSMYILGQVGTPLERRTSSAITTRAIRQASSVFFRTEASTPRKLFVSKFDRRGRPDMEYGDGGSTIVHRVLEHAQDTPMTLSLNDAGRAVFTATVHPKMGVAETSVGVLTSQGNMDGPFGEEGSGLVRIRANEIPLNGPYRDADSVVNDAWFDGSMVRVLNHHYVMPSTEPGHARGERIRFFTMDIPLRRPQHPYDFHKFLTLARATPRDELDAQGAATVISASKTYMFLVLLNPTVEPQNLVLRKYRLSNGRRMSGVDWRTHEVLSNVRFRSLHPEKDGGVILYLQKAGSGSLLKVFFDSKLVLRQIFEIQNVTEEQDSYRDCAAWLRQQVGEPFKRSKK